MNPDLDGLAPSYFIISGTGTIELPGGGVVTVGAASTPSTVITTPTAIGVAPTTAATGTLLGLPINTLMLLLLAGVLIVVLLT